MQALKKVFMVAAILVGMYFLGSYEQARKDRQEAKDRSEHECARSWFTAMAGEEWERAAAGSTIPFDVNGSSRVTEFSELDTAFRRFDSSHPEPLPWAGDGTPLMQKFECFLDRAPEGEDDIRLYLARMKTRSSFVQIHVRPGTEPKVIGFRITGPASTENK